ncbi:MAG: class I SAM-dependent methyltransferase [Candidatus Lokiarchaeota archaeon]|nr:class I SAM-dependent methyltransferase [Candidatus Lokiarchaeota archaeon]
MKECINLDKVALIGRTYQEYEKMFRLKDFSSSKARILDVGAGVSSFCAEANNKGLKAVALDPIYEHEQSTLEKCCKIDLEKVIRELDGVEHLYIWDIFRTKDALKKQREKAYKYFLEDYRRNNFKYLAGKMPETGFKDRQFDIVLSSHLLFIYEHFFDYEFHLKTIKEMLRISSNEVRIFPLVNLKGQKSKYVEKLLEDGKYLGFNISIEKVNYEFIRNGNEMMRVTVYY